MARRARRHLAGHLEQFLSRRWLAGGIDHLKCIMQAANGEANRFIWRKIDQFGANAKELLANNKRKMAKSAELWMPIK